MGTSISKSTIIENIYKNWYDILNTVSAFTNKIYPEFHDNISLTNKSSYPIFILDSAEISEEQLTMKKTEVSGTISFNIFTTTPKDTDQYTSDAKDKIETSKTTLSSYGIHKVFLENTDKDVVLQGKIKVHIKTLNWRFIVHHDKTFAY